MWDEKGVRTEMHRTAVLELLGECGEHIDALELNGLRPWSENRQAILLGQTWSKPATVMLSSRTLFSISARH
jgi:hypothetical protein